MNGSFIWYELMTDDTAAAVEFYTRVTGWQAKDAGMPGMSYTIFSVPGFEMGVAGMMGLTPEMKDQGVPPNWGGYVYVDDVDAKAKEFAENGGTVHKQPEDIPQVGRFAVVSDPHGAVIYLFKPDMPEGPLPPSPEVNSPGTFACRELMAGDGAEAMAFYSKMFGWKEDEALDIGAMGFYRLFSVDGVQQGGIMTRPPEVPVANWGYYINVEAIDAAAERVKAGGGQVLNGPMEVPGGGWIINCMDPQGAYFSLTAAKR